MTYKIQVSSLTVLIINIFIFSTTLAMEPIKNQSQYSTCKQRITTGVTNFLIELEQEKCTPHVSPNIGPSRGLLSSLISSLKNEIKEVREEQNQKKINNIFRNLERVDSQMVMDDKYFRLFQEEASGKKIMTNCAFNEELFTKLNQELLERIESRIELDDDYFEAIRRDVMESGIEWDESTNSNSLKKILIEIYTDIYSKRF